MDRASDFPSCPLPDNDLYLAAARRFADLFDGMPAACFTFDHEGTVFEWNAAAEELWERPASQAFQSELVPAARMEDNIAAIEELRKQVSLGEKVRNLEWDIHFEDGRIKWVQVSAFPIRDAQGRVTGGMISALDITGRKELQSQLEAYILQNNENQVLLEVQKDELAMMNAKLADLASTDGLTGLKNHRTFQEFLEQQFLIAKRSSVPLSMVLLDVDHFKALNDQFGHPAGDEVLRGVAGVLSAYARKSDFVARYGGEEFVAVLPATDATGAIEAAERFRTAIAKRDFPTGTVTASFGCATLHRADETRDALIARADLALYEAKHSGRNRTVHADRMKKAA